MAGNVFAILPYEFKAPSGTAQGWRVTAALAALAAVAVLGGVCVLASGLLALPALASAIQFSLFQLLLAVVALATQSVAATISIRRALRRGRRLRARAAGAR